jgi:alpha-glucoside transport system substrate-binding protein
VVEEAMDALHWALQAAGVAYPRGDVPIAVRTGPDGPRGVPLVSLDELVALASGAAGRELADAECRTYLHLAACGDAQPVGQLPAITAVRAAAGVAPIERLAAESLAGTRVDVVSALPVDLAPLLGSFASETGIDVTVDAAADDELAARVAAGDVPDLAIVTRPSTLATLARQGHLIDLAATADVADLRSRAGSYLVRLGTVAADGAWPAEEGGLFGAPLAVEASSQVWYPVEAFRRAGYREPGTLAELDELVARMVGDGHTPWCLGLGTSGTLGANDEVGAAGADFVEELVLHEAGPAAYDEWTSGSLPFTDSVVRDAFEHFGRLVLRDERVLTGTSHVFGIPRELAALPLLLDQPRCWLYRATGSERAAVPAAHAGRLAAFPFPAADGQPGGTARGRVYQLVVFRDRPEVRRVLALLLGDELATTGTAALVEAGLWPVALADAAFDRSAVATRERDILERTLADGSFRVDASDLVPHEVAERFSDSMREFASRGLVGLPQVLREIQDAWPEAGP